MKRKVVCTKKNSFTKTDLENATKKLGSALAGITKDFRQNTEKLIARRITR